MIIEIKSDGNGAWNLVAKDHADAWPPQHMAYGRNRVQIEFLIRSILADHESADANQFSQVLAEATLRAAGLLPRDNEAYPGGES